MIASATESVWLALRRSAWKSFALALASVLSGDQLFGAEAEPAKVEDKKPADWKEYDPKKAPDPPGGVARAKTEAQAMIRAGQLSNREVFDSYWKWYFAQITKYQERHRLDAYRTDLARQLRGRSGAPQQRLVRDIALPMTTEIAKDQGYAPIVRYNAVLILGDLNQVEPNNSGKGAVALPEALKPILEFLDTKRPADGGVNDALRLAAIVGVQNHIERGGIPDPAMRRQATKLLEQIANDDTALKTRGSEVHDWMKTRAQEALAKLGGDAAVAERPRVTAATATSGR